MLLFYRSSNPIQEVRNTSLTPLQSLEPKWVSRHTWACLKTRADWDTARATSAALPRPFPREPGAQQAGYRHAKHGPSYDCLWTSRHAREATDVQQSSHTVHEGDRMRHRSRFCVSALLGVVILGLVAVALAKAPPPPAPSPSRRPPLRWGLACTGGRVCSPPTADATRSPSRVWKSAVLGCPGCRQSGRSTICGGWRIFRGRMWRWQRMRPWAEGRGS